jgi:N-acetylneuraminic acid mutarotase
MPKALPLLSLLFAVVFTGGLGGCTPNPPISGLPETGWRCSAINGYGKPFLYNDADKAVAMERAKENCQNGSDEPFSCQVGPENCTSL